MANNLGMLLGFGMSILLFNHLGMQLACLLSVIAGLLGTGLSFFVVNKKQLLSEVTLEQLIGVGKNRKSLIFTLLARIQKGIQMSTTMSFTNQIVHNLSGSILLVGISSIIYMLAAVTFAWVASTTFIKKMQKKNWIMLSFVLLAFYFLAIPMCRSIILIYCL